MRSDTEKIRLFNDKADRLLRSGFVVRLRKGDFGVSVSVRDRSATTTARAPTEDELHAVAVTLRFFLQDNEPTSIRNMAELYDRLDLSADWQRRFRKSRENLNADLDAPSGLVFAGEVLTNRRLLMTVLYGDLVHSATEKEQDLRLWTRHEPFGSLVMLHFYKTAGSVVNFVEWSARVHLDLLKERGV